MVEACAAYARKENSVGEVGIGEPGGPQAHP